MSLKTHRLLNAILPYAVRNVGRSAALRFIPSVRHTDMESRLRQLANLGVVPSVILDVGAASGNWAKMAHRIWSAARIVGFEPNAHQVPVLERVRAELPGSEFIRGFLGTENKLVRYANEGQQTSLLAEVGDAQRQAEAPMYVLDELLAAGRIPQPQFIKLDVQGFELEVLRGGTQLMAGVEAILTEVSFVRAVPGMPVAEDVLAFMRDRGFAWYDTTSLLRGAKTDRMVQADFLFLRHGHRLLADLWD